MKRVLFLALVLLSAVSMVGCCSSPGYARRCPTYGACGTVGVGVVDYVDGGPGACEADCGTTCGANYGTTCGAGCSGVYSGGAVGCGGCRQSSCTDCLQCVGDGIRVVGESALGLVAAPFIVARHMICSGCNGYESYPNCGCSNEVYYGDDCYQMHDFCDPCACGGGTVKGHSGCATCNGGYSEGIQASPDVTGKAPVNRIQTVSGNGSTHQHQPIRVSQGTGNHPPQPLANSHVVR